MASFDHKATDPSEAAAKLKALLAMAKHDDNMIVGPEIPEERLAEMRILADKDPDWRNDSSRIDTSSDEEVPSHSKANVHMVQWSSRSPSPSYREEKTEKRIVTFSDSVKSASAMEFNNPLPGLDDIPPESSSQDLISIAQSVDPTTMIYMTQPTTTEYQPSPSTSPPPLNNLKTGDPYDTSQYHWPPASDPHGDPMGSITSLRRIEHNMALIYLQMIKLKSEMESIKLTMHHENITRKDVDHSISTKLEELKSSSAREYSDLSRKMSMIERNIKIAQQPPQSSPSAPPPSLQPQQSQRPIAHEKTFAEKIEEIENHISPQEAIELWGVSMKPPIIRDAVYQRIVEALIKRKSNK